MQIFVIPSSFPTNINPQASIFVYEQCEMLASLGHRVVVLDAMTYSWKHWLDKSCSSIHHTQRSDMDVYSLHVRGAMKKKLPRLAVYQFRKKMKKLYKHALELHGKPDIIYAHFSRPSGYVACEIGEREDIPVVVLEHYGGYLESSIHPYLQTIVQSTVNRSSAFLCVSEAHKEALEKWSGIKDKIQVIPNMIADRFRYYPRQTSDSFCFFSAGNLVSIKRFDMLISAFTKAFSPDAKVVLRIAGAGKERANLEQLISNSNHGQIIHLLGRLNRDEMLDEYKNSDCFVLVSNHESFGIVYREAMAVGRPVISTDNGGIREGWDDRLGIIVPIGDETALVEALQSVYDNKNRQIYDHKAISEITISKYGASSIISRLLVIFEQAIRK